MTQLSAKARLKTVLKAATLTAWERSVIDTWFNHQFRLGQIHKMLLYSMGCDLRDEMFRIRVMNQMFLDNVFFGRSGHRAMVINFVHFEWTMFRAMNNRVGQLAIVINLMKLLWLHEIVSRHLMNDRPNPGEYFAETFVKTLVLHRSRLGIFETVERNPRKKTRFARVNLGDISAPRFANYLWIAARDPTIDRFLTNASAGTIATIEGQYGKAWMREGYRKHGCVGSCLKCALCIVETVRNCLDRGTRSARNRDAYTLGPRMFQEDSIDLVPLDFSQVNSDTRLPAEMTTVLAPRDEADIFEMFGRVNAVRRKFLEEKLADVADLPFSATFFRELMNGSEKWNNRRLTLTEIFDTRVAPEIVEKLRALRCRADVVTAENPGRLEAYHVDIASDARFVNYNQLLKLEDESINHGTISIQAMKRLPMYVHSKNAYYCLFTLAYVTLVSILLFVIACIIAATGANDTTNNGNSTSASANAGASAAIVTAATFPQACLAFACVSAACTILAWIARWYFKSIRFV